MVVGPWEAPQDCDCGHLLWDLQQPAAAGRGRRLTSFLGSSTTPIPGGAPGNAVGLRCGGAARVPSGRVWAAWSSLPAGARQPAGGRAPGVWVAGTEASEPRPGDLAPHLAPPLVGRCWVGHGISVSGPGDPRGGSSVTHTCPVVGWLRVGVTSPCNAVLALGFSFLIC